MPRPGPLDLVELAVVGDRSIDRLGGEIQLDPVIMPVGGEPAAAGLELRGGLRVEDLLLPEHMGSRQGGVTAEIDLDPGCKPAETKQVACFHRVDERGLGEVHLGRDMLHPVLGGGGVKDADCRGIAVKRLVGERINLDDAAGSCIPS